MNWNEFFKKLTREQKIDLISEWYVFAELAEKAKTEEEKKKWAEKLYKYLEEQGKKFGVTVLDLRMMIEDKDLDIDAIGKHLKIVRKKNSQKEKEYTDLEREVRREVLR